MPTRSEVSFLSGGERCAAWYYPPVGPGPHPIVVMAHGIGAIRQVRLPAYAERFQTAGFGVLCFDYRGWGESEGAPRFIADIASQHKDIHAALDFAKTLPGSNPARLALWGTSFGGAHVLAVAAGRSDLSAVISQCAVVDCLAVAMSTPLPQMLRWSVAATRDVFRKILGRRPYYVPLASEPGTSGVMTKLDAEKQYRSLLMEPSRWENKLAARIFLFMPFYRAINSAPRIAAPLLMIVTGQDEICSGELQAKAAKLAPQGTARVYQTTHFGIYFDELFERATADMVDFLQRNLTPSRIAA